MRYLMLISLLLVAAPAFSQGAISLGTPVTFVTPETITHWDPDEVVFRPGANASISITLHARQQPAVKITFELPRDCAVKVTPSDPESLTVCPTRDTSAEVDAAITFLNSANGNSRTLWRRIMDDLVLFFPTRFSGGGTVQ